MGDGIRKFSAVPPAGEKMVAVGHISAGHPLDLHVPPRDPELQTAGGKPAGLNVAEVESGNTDFLRFPAACVIARPSVRQAGEPEIEPRCLKVHKIISPM